MSESKYLKPLLEEVGHSVHNLNTIAVSLSNLPKAPSVPSGMNIKWAPQNITSSSHNARRFAVRSAIVFSVEVLFEYLRQLSNDNMWKLLNNDKNFRKELKSQNSKAKRFSVFCEGIPGLENEWRVLVELLCHWRNRIVHASTSKASLSSSDRQFLLSRTNYFYNGFHHFDVDKAVKDFEVDKVTLKEATTLITLLIKCVRKIDEFYLDEIGRIDIIQFKEKLESNDDFLKIKKLAKSKKRERQINRFIALELGYLSNESRVKIAESYT
jgi:hypothetical protein